MNFSNQITQVFIMFLEQDESLLTKLHQCDALYDQEQWRFTLPQLHNFMQSTQDPLFLMPYLDFRKNLFNSDINKQLHANKAEIAIFDNRQNVDTSTYVLRRL
ncbi:MAG: hypothetical protein KUG73_15425 [Pseudomonadales bacterium]|nr:hypothetical protein [Pseudomonadales bacterium]